MNKKVHKKSRQGNAEPKKGRNFLHELAVCLQENMGIDPSITGATYCYSVLAQHMYYACEHNDNHAEVLFESLPDYGLSEAVRWELIANEMCKEHTKEVPKHIGKSIMEAVLFMCAKFKEGGAQ